jgi:hypothetical protein
MVPPFLVDVVTGRLQVTELAGEDDETRYPPQATVSEMRVSERADRVAARITHM